MFASITGTYLVKHLLGTPLYGRLLALSSSITLGWKDLRGASTPAYYVPNVIKKLSVIYGFS